MSPRILAIDTSTENCSVALMVDNQCFVRRDIAPRDHAKKILPMVDEVLHEANVQLADLDALAFGRGPGSFTGVRICIGIAQGLAFGAGLPTVPVSTLEAMAQGSYRLHGAAHVASAIDARMSEVYWGRFARQDNGAWQVVDDECVIPPQTLTQQLESDSHTWCCAGTGWAAYHEALSQLPIQVASGDVLYPDAEDIVFLAKIAFEDGKTVPAEEASPIYLRDQVAWKKMPGRG
ncbi:tRNA (adenosine(37)-N6)-threonylcarbamoyltransferase complex dimerization subunit type 1 TsaB [Vibrio gazogenes]|uniref:tRNA threonylcarbamoyladenosine biosynthesis protein TsaB n=1 Tax=Vibrio gazogenes DSM 21264 = NBRC 103151 TaxID=1123492 RepID=A0A1M5EWH1_VIBGA|nr:tRNA (adenosine(37)-N6)-threonylcarbamoyltransferase complex dimerization subunit type 1 TsaB [Vibrio gazogenes]USP14796.1 tRNA (adenosine(37)-N6)-threonylcarbamoyltransferase complex dimerization subunit type 1 TsaB [Vibrio gazogenes]SHF83476.1 tRNA threonylcarbamoyladenosine biosynthesis protein TsaB [Vibrio gazogenes DSM 21264] [Vibrio gazogenes DSM 21264 = NBRC 103151]SJN55179.1 tRNA threonylcarbamoyladenosine biosynthesis protein TsaB [Vibrio gazogenes]